MQRIQVFLSFLMSFLLLSASAGLEGCGSRDATPAAVAQQTANNSSQAPAQPPADGSSSQAAPSDQGQQSAQLPEVNLSADGLDELLAPVALYPDPVLAVLLQASVDPQEVMDGGNWLALDQNQNLKEAALDVASQKAGFTPVMQALLHYPTVVDLMCQQFDWTKQLGAAYQGNPKAVLESVQRLRAQAVDTGALKSSPQMSVNLKQDQGKEIVELKPADPKIVYVPQYNPAQVFSTTTTTTSGGTTTTTTTTSGAPSATNSTVVVQQEKSGVSTGTAVMIGLLAFGAGIAVGSAINNNHYYYPAWGYGGVYYGPRPYYPPPYRPVYYPGWGGGYHYNRPVHYGNTNIYINNNNNYYNRFNNNNNLNANYRPNPVPYNNNQNGVYAKSMGNNPGGNQGANYRPSTTNNASNWKGQNTYQGNKSGGAANANVNARPATGNVQNRPGGASAGSNANNAQRPGGGNNSNNLKGQSTYQGNKAGNTANTMQGRPTTTSGNANAGANNRVNAGNPPARNPSGDRGFAQAGGTRPTTGSTQASRPSTANAPASRPAASTQPPARSSSQPSGRPESSSGGAFGGASNAKSDKAASSRGQASMSAKPNSSGGTPRKR